MKSSQQDIKNAVNRFLAGEFKSLGEAERETGVKRQTITTRLNGVQSHQEAHQSK